MPPTPPDHVLIDMYSDKSVILRDISPSARCRESYEAMYHCFETKARDTRPTLECKQFIRTWEACLAKDHGRGNLAKSS